MRDCNVGVRDQPGALKCISSAAAEGALRRSAPAVRAIGMRGDRMELKTVQSMLPPTAVRSHNCQSLYLCSK